jgi:hypothetical protein
MSDSSTRIRGQGLLFALTGIGLLLAAGLGQAQQGSTPVSWEPRVALGKCLAPDGTLLASDDPSEGWRPLRSQDTVHSRDQILALPGVQGKLSAGPAPVELTLWGNLPELSAFPGLQSAVILHDSRAFDLDVTVLRGRVVLTNRKKEGSTQVWLRVQGGAVQLSLDAPGSSLAVETFGLWPHGVPFRRGAEADHKPMRTVDFLMLKGQGQVRARGNRYRLTAPPGPAYFHWDNVNGADEVPLARDHLPPWADPDSPANPEAALAGEVARSLSGSLKDNSPSAVLAGLLEDADRQPNKAHVLREVAIHGLAAMNDLPPVVNALDSKDADTRGIAVVALRHWIGEEIGRDDALYRLLIRRRDFTPAQAETIMQLLHSPYEPDDAEAYDVLLAYLSHRRLAVRELAHWHLMRLVPDGRKITYDAAAPEADRARGLTAWQELIRKKLEKKKD